MRTGLVILTLVTVFTFVASPSYGQAPAPAPGTTVQVQPATPTPQPAPGTTITGQVVRVVGQDQVIVRTADGKEVTVYTTPQTTYSFNNQPGAFTTLQPGYPVNVDYNMVDNRHTARRIFGGRR